MMRKTIAAGLALASLGACTVTPPKPAGKPAEHVSLHCGVFPVTENLWGAGYDNMVNSKVDPDWGQGIYEGFGTTARVLATPLYLVADVFMAPLRIGQPCVEPAAAVAQEAGPAAAPKPATKKPPATRTPPAKRPAYRQPAPPPSGTTYSRPRPKPAPPPPAYEAEPYSDDP
jgi:hypothetical protein